MAKVRWTSPTRKIAYDRENELGGRTPMGVDQIVERLALEPGELILEVGLDSDCDNEFRSAIEKRTGTKFIEGATTEVVDAVLLWWRDGDGDLVDDLMDGLTYLTETSDQSSVGSSPRLFAASYDLLRLLVPRHPPFALNNFLTFFCFLKQRCSRSLCSSQDTGEPRNVSRLTK